MYNIQVRRWGCVGRNRLTVTGKRDCAVVKGSNTSHCLLPPATPAAMRTDNTCDIDNKHVERGVRSLNTPLPGGSRMESCHSLSSRT